MFHNHLVQQAATIFKDAGLLVHLEYPIKLPDGRTNYVDLFITRDWDIPTTCVCEVETTPRYVLVNVEKALALKLPLCVIVPDRKLKTSIESKVQKVFPEGDLHHVCFLLPDEITQVLTRYFPIFSAVNREMENRKNRKTKHSDWFPIGFWTVVLPMTYLRKRETQWRSNGKTY